MLQKYRKNCTLKKINSYINYEYYNVLENTDMFHNTKNLKIEKS